MNSSSEKIGLMLSMGDIVDELVDEHKHIARAIKEIKIAEKMYSDLKTILSNRPPIKVKEQYKMYYGHGKPFLKELIKDMELKVSDLKRAYSELDNSEEEEE